MNILSQVAFLLGHLILSENGVASDPTSNPDYPSPELIRRWAPQVRLHSDEAYFPSAVEDFMSKSEMFYGSRSHNGVLAKPRRGAVTSETINSFEDPNNPNVKSGDRSAPGRFRLILRSEDSAHRRGRTSIKSGTNLPPVYVAIHSTTTFYDIKYIFFYPYNGPSSRFISGLGAHEGDIEHITVRLRRGTNALMGILYSAHGSSESFWHKPAAIKKFGTHPVVYSAKSSHANYIRAGNYKRIGRNLGPITIHFAADKCNDGYRWNTWKNVINVGSYKNPLNGQLWTSFSGRWGRFKDKGCFGVKTFWGDKWCLVDYPDEDGSSNLALKSWFHGVEEGGPR